MKKTFIAVMTAVIMSFAFTGCGSNRDAGADKEEKTKDKPTAVSIVGEWKYSGIEMTENGETLSKDDIEPLLGGQGAEIIHLKAYGDGTAVIVLFGSESECSWTEEHGAYTITLPGTSDDGESDESMKAELKGNTLSITSEESYMSTEEEDGVESSEENSIVTVFELKYVGKVSKIIEGWDVELSDSETYAMSNFMNDGSFVIVNDDILYGNFGGKEYGKGTFSMGKIKEDGKDLSVEDRKTVEKNAYVKYLTEYDGYVYGVINDEKIVKIKAGETKAETVYEGTCSYMQVAGKKIYFTDEENRYCSTDLKGKNKEILLDKAVYLTYMADSEHLIYQDDADGESLHVYNVKTGSDVKLNDMISYSPMLSGENLYFKTPAEEEGKYYVGCVNMYSGQVETNEQPFGLYAMYLGPDEITYAPDGFISMKTDEWKTIDEKSYGGYEIYPMYDNGKIRIAQSFGEVFIKNAGFADTSVSQNEIGFVYVSGQ